MMYIRWGIIRLISYFVLFISLILAPFAALTRKNDHLARCFWFMETYDNPVTGDKNHWNRWCWVRNLLGESFGLYFQTWGWLWRNKAYNFDYYYLGADINCPVKWKGNTQVSSDKYNPVFGKYYATDGKYFCLWIYKPWLTIGKFSLCVRIFIGWKFKSEQYRTGSGKKHCMLATHFNPFRYHIK